MKFMWRKGYTGPEFRSKYLQEEAKERKHFLTDRKIVFQIFPRVLCGFLSKTSDNSHSNIDFDSVLKTTGSTFLSSWQRMEDAIKIQLFAWSCRYSQYSLKLCVPACSWCEFAIFWSNFHNFCRVPTVPNLLHCLSPGIIRFLRSLSHHSFACWWIDLNPSKAACSHVHIMPIKKWQTIETCDFGVLTRQRLNGKTSSTFPIPNACWIGNIRCFSFIQLDYCRVAKFWLKGTSERSPFHFPFQFSTTDSLNLFKEPRNSVLWVFRWQAQWSDAAQEKSQQIQS